MEQTIENNPSDDSQVAGATTGEQSHEATGNSEATPEPILGKFNSQEDLVQAYKELETRQTELGTKANKGERYEQLVDFLATSQGLSRYEVEAQLDQQLSNPTAIQTPQGQPNSTRDPKVAELERKMDWNEVAGKSPELSSFKEQILDYANAKNISVAEAVSKLKPIFDSGKEAAKAKETEKSEATVATSTTTSEQETTLKRQYNDQLMRVQKIKSGEIDGNLRQENLTLLRLSDELNQQTRG